MKSFNSYILLVGLAFFLVSCHKKRIHEELGLPDPPIENPDTPSETTYPTFEAPHWNVKNMGTYECTMTAIMSLPDSLASSQQPNDEIAVFSNGVCRGIGECVETSPYRYAWMVMIMGNPDENLVQEFDIRYWSSFSKYMYNSDTNIVFATDTRLGDIDAPHKLGLTIKTNNTQDK